MTPDQAAAPTLEEYVKRVGPLTIQESPNLQQWDHRVGLCLGEHLWVTTATFTLLEDPECFEQVAKVLRVVVVDPLANNRRDA